MKKYPEPSAGGTTAGPGTGTGTTGTGTTGTGTTGTGTTGTGTTGTGTTGTGTAGSGTTGTGTGTTGPGTSAAGSGGSGTGGTGIVPGGGSGGTSAGGTGGNVPNANFNGAIKPVGNAQGAVLREIDTNAPTQQSDMSGVRRAAALLQGVDSTVQDGPHVANQGAVQYLRGSGANPALASQEARAAANAQLSAAKLMIHTGDFSGAKKALDDMISLDPNDFRALARRAELFNHLKDYKAAEADARRALALDPNNALAWSQLAWSLLKQKRYKEALEAADRAILADPNSASNYAVRAYIKSMLGDAAGALADLEKAASLDPRFKDQFEAARKGAKIYDPDSDDDSLEKMIFGTTRASGRAIFFAAASLLLAAVAGAAFVGFKRGRRASAMDKGLRT